MTYPIPDVECAEEGCTNTYKPHRWGQIKAHDAGWFFPKEGPAVCPDHIPPWLHEWRKKRKRKT